jgi:protein TonB
MTNKEILQADLLDILFENRNKAYGAYALRKYYNHRLQWAVGISLTLVFFLLLMMSSRKKDFSNSGFHNRELTVVTDDSQKIKPKEVEPKPKRESKIARLKSVNRIEFAKDETDVPPVDDINIATPSNQTIGGQSPNEAVQIEINTNDGNGNDTKDEKIEQAAPIFSHSDAQFPGGREAFAEFLKRYLNTPGDLEVGEKKIILVRFMVDADGRISKAEILQSGGEKYDREVIRVLRKMPKWIPALQNGITVATYFVQPVTFIGVEE